MSQYFMVVKTFRKTNNFQERKTRVNVWKSMWKVSLYYDQKIP